MYHTVASRKKGLIMFANREEKTVYRATTYKHDRTKIMCSQKLGEEIFCLL